MRANIRKYSGFTLLELLVVMVIIGLLVGYVAPLYFKQVGKSEVKVARAQIESFGKALDQALASEKNILDATRAAQNQPGDALKREQERLRGEQEKNHELTNKIADEMEKLDRESPSGKLASERTTGFGMRWNCS